MSWPDLGPNNLQRLLTDDKSGRWHQLGRQRLYNISLLANLSLHIVSNSFLKAD